MKVSALLASIPLGLLALASPLHAADLPTITSVDQLEQPACHLAENRKTDYCQNVMFPPIPFR